MLASTMSYIRNDLLAAMDLGSSSAAVHGRSPLRREDPGSSGPVLQRYYYHLMQRSLHPDITASCPFCWNGF